MATASHEHIPDLSASLSKSHHRGPISDLWGPSLSQKRQTEMVPDYAMEIAMDTSRGPLMSSASSAMGHEIAEEPVIASDTPAIPIASKVGSALWSSAPAGSAPSSASVSAAQSAPSAAAASSATPGSASGPLHLRSLAASGSPSYRAPHHPTGASTVNPVGSMGHFRSGIWGPRQSFGSFNGPAAGFAQTPAASNVYAKTPWSVDIGSAPTTASPVSAPTMGGISTAAGPAGMANPAAQGIPPISSPVNGGGIATPGSVPVQAFYGVGSASTPASMAGATQLQANDTPPRTSPSPPSASGSSAARLYQARPGQQPAMDPSMMPSNPQTPSQVAVAQSIRNHHAAHEGLMNGTHGRPAKKNGRPSTNTELYKTELCASYMSTGGNCPYGEKCQFAHGPEELKSVDRPPKWRSKPCQNWVKTGSCSYNERCCFRHDVPVGHGQQ